MAARARRPGDWSRTTAHRDMRAWARRNWRFLAIPGAPIALEIAFNEWAEPSTFLRGFLDGFIVATWMATVFVIAAVSSGSWPKLWGAAGETFTADEFARTRRRKQGWRIFHGLRIGGIDIDHIAVGPGGILAIESKFVSSGRWRLTETGIAGAIKDPLMQARISRQKADAFLRVSTTGGQLPVDVLAVLVVWGPGCPSIPGGHAEVEGVHVFSGEDQRAWRRWLDIDRVRPQLVERAAESLQRFASGARSLDRDARRAAPRRLLSKSVG
jgi:hypothetical protein